MHAKNFKIYPIYYHEILGKINVQYYLFYRFVFQKCLKYNMQSNSCYFILQVDIQKTRFLSHDINGQDCSLHYGLTREKSFIALQYPHRTVANLYFSV